ncbi:MAG TPA: hypothetical protein PLL72_10520 [Burkholderiaceae bacterium]|nr:hypothetical protein [Burkholderiaceae bacterium]
MPITPDAPFPKTQGDNIRSKDWNDTVNEVIRLDNAKLNRNGADTLQGPLAVSTRIGVGLGGAAPSENLHTAGRVRAGDLVMGDWPPNAAYQFIGAGSLNQAAVGNYALLQGTTAAGGDSGRTMLNSPVGLSFRIANGERMSLSTSALSVSTRVGVSLGATSPSENLHTADRVRAGNMVVGDWPANANYQFVGVSTLNQAAPGNYALLQGAATAGSDHGRTYLNSPIGLHFRISNVDSMTIDTAHTVVNWAGNPLRFSTNWTGFPDDSFNRAEICNDTGVHKTLMLVGNRSSGTRKVSVWDRLEVNGPLITQQAHTIKIGVPNGPYGNDGIRGEPNLWLDAASTVFIKQGFQARGMDVAERFPVAAEVLQGHVVVFDEDAGGIRPCAAAYDPTAVGIVSEAPACIIGLGSGDAPIALVGRVPCWVDADIAPVRAGDLLVSSPTPGHAQKLVDGERGRGRVIGKALQSLPSGKAQILTFVLAA